MTDQQKRDYIDQASLKEPSEQDKAWIILLAYAQGTINVLNALRTMSVMQNNKALENRTGETKTVLKLHRTMQRTGTDFVNSLREFRALYLKENHRGAGVADSMLMLILKAMNLPLTTGVARMGELGGYLDNFDQGQYRDIDPKWFEAIEDMPTDPSAAVNKLIDQHCPRTSKINREKLALAFEQMVWVAQDVLVHK